MVSDNRVGYLEALVEELRSRGLVARLIRARSGPAFLRVVNPEAASLAENVTCDPVHQGATGAAPAGPPGHDEPDYFWWSWGERMHRVDDPCGAARKVARVLEVHT